LRQESGVDGVAKRRRRLRGTAIAEHALVPRFARKFVGFLASSGSAPTPGSNCRKSFRVI
jgi:hypothetical protein